MLHDHGSLYQSARNLLGFATFLYCQSVFREFHAIDVVKRTPKEIVSTIILNEKRVDTILYSHFAGYEQLMCIMETTVRSITHGYTNTTFPCLPPLRFRVVKHILPIDIVDVWSPDATLRHEIHRAGNELSVDEFSLDAFATEDIASEEAPVEEELSVDDLASLEALENLGDLEALENLEIPEEGAATEEASLEELPNLEDLASEFDLNLDEEPAA